MSRKNDRIEHLIEIIKNNNVGSQEELLKMLADKGIFVTQATLSRDLKMLKTTKVPLDHGSYAYMLPDALTTKLNSSGRRTAEFTRHAGNGFISLEFSNNIGVMLTRNGYASGIAYDIDMLNAPEIAGTIAGANTVFIVFREGVSHEQATEVLSLILPVKTKGND
ncbi:MAG: arginine repressor [Muribaculaceae bacterium]|nr:arginine repressor [Muribaculaceae bacterium]MDE6522234.1 arginine repressor [Muribaculaceae bacterium]MDE6786302.1 arginine repressor [Muribaculaceae bacterium]